MRLALRYIIFSGIAIVAPSFFFAARAQERCGTVEYSKSLHPDYPLRKIDFEKWMTGKNLSARTDRRMRQQTAIYRIPVVVHIIHNGEPIGTGANIPDEQVLSQLRVLNEDFRRENADATNTPPEFAALAGALDIEFVLAKQDQDGQPTTGIVRVDGNRNGWTITDQYTMKDLSYWPAEKYMNIWVCNLTDQYIGYAQFPESDLQGHENSSTNAETDGVVIWHKAFGSSDDGDFNLDPVFDKGRTTTHEVGHFFGLNHIWGDDNGCNGTDYVSDTPNQGPRTSGCPSHPKTDNCGEVVMFQNFLDYSDDDCMNLFTQGQAERMTVVIENSPRRNSLLASPGLEEPDPLPNDLGVRTVIFPDASVCSNSVTPVVELRNYGNNLITGAQIRFTLGGNTVETRDFALSLNPEETVNVSFSALDMPSGTHEISFQVVSTNGVADAGRSNDLKTSNVTVPAFIAVPFTQNFSSPPQGWITQNFDGQITWEIASAPNDMAGNKALKLNYFEYEERDRIGEIDVFLSPVFDLSDVPVATLMFDVAYARYLSSDDALQVIALTDCEGLSQGDTLYDKTGDVLKTTAPKSQPFTPSNESQWRKELIDLSAFVGMNKVQLAFVGVNDGGNNLYVDNIMLVTDETRDATLVRLVSPSVVTCADEIVPRLLVRNTGSIPLDDVVVDYALNGSAVQSLTVTGLNLSFGKEKEIDLPAINLSEGKNTLEVSLRDPHGETDHNPADNTRSFVIIVNKSEDRIPLRENFESEIAPAWTIANPSGGMDWEITETNFGESLYFNGFDNEVIGDEAWLVSPVLDFSRTVQSSMLFDLSYAQRIGSSETLKILVSTDCGVTYEEVGYNFPDTEISDESWAPQNEDDWQRRVFVNLSKVAGQQNVRIAFVVRNQNGNNLYLDNIEFFITVNPDPIEITDVYSIYGYDLDHPELSDLRITFNLPERQDVHYTLINAIGEMEADGIITDVLNQTYPLNLSGRLAPGIYFIRVDIGDKFYSSRVLVF